MRNTISPALQRGVAVAALDQPRAKARDLYVSAMLALLGGFCLAQNIPQVPGDDTILRAMREEMDRSRMLRATGLEVPYYFEYKVEDQESLNIAATLGGLLNVHPMHLRIPVVTVRAGGYDSDNTNHLYAGSGGGTRFDSDSWPLEDNLSAFRNSLWLATDHAYKSAVESLSIKREILKQTNVTEPLPDFWKAQPFVHVVSPKHPPLDTELWKSRSIHVSAAFLPYPEIMSSGTEFEALASSSYFLNSEGSVDRYPDMLTSLRIRAATQAPDGMMLRDATVRVSFDSAKMAPEAEMIRDAIQVADNLRALGKAPIGESYNGPTLFEPGAAAQLLGYLIGENIRIGRKPLAEPGRAVQSFSSDFEGKIGSRVLPDYFDVVDDPTQTEYKGRALAGTYVIDNDGVPPKAISVIESGVLKDVLRSRLPIKGFQDSNGHGRLPSGYGSNQTAIGNLFIKARQAKKLADLRAQFLKSLQDRNKPYGLIVRKLDYPSTANFAELQQMLVGMSQASGGGRPVPYPTLVYRVYPDGREELVRGLRFRGVSTRSLKDIAAASEETAQFDFINNSAPFAVMGATGYLAPASVIAPGILFDELEFERIQDEASKLPVAPPPPRKLP